MVESHKIKSKNLNLFHISKLFELPNFWLPYIYIYLSEYKHLPLAQVFFLLGLQEFALIFLELPTGVVADKISRKFSVGLGYIVTFLPLALLPFANNFWTFFVLLFIKAMGRALVSGADTSLLYDTLLDLKKEERYKNELSKAKSLTFGFTALSLFLSGFIASFNIDLVFMLPLPFALIGAIAMFLMKEPEISVEQKRFQEKNYFKHAWKSFFKVFRVKSLIVPILIFAIVESIAVQLKYIYTPFFASLETELSAMGGIVSIFYVVRSVSAFVNSKIKAQDEAKILIVSTFISMISFVLIGIFVNPIFAIVLFTIEVFAESVSVPAIGHSIHRKLESSNRATSMSSINLVCSIFASSIIWVFGAVSEVSDIRYAIFFISFLYLISFFLSNILFKRRICRHLS